MSPGLAFFCVAAFSGLAFCDANTLRKFRAMSWASGTADFVISESSTSAAYLEVRLLAKVLRCERFTTVSHDGFCNARRV